MTDTEVINALDDVQTLALTAWAEARAIPRNDPDSHSPIEELVAVMVVARNRRTNFKEWRATDASYKSICLAPNQFSCWNSGTDPNHLALLAQARFLSTFCPDATNMPAIDSILKECLFLAKGVIDGTLVDRTNAATEYYAPASMKPANRIPLSAVGKEMYEIGDQKFYKV